MFFRNRRLKKRNPKVTSPHSSHKLWRPVKWRFAGAVAMSLCFWVPSVILAIVLDLILGLNPVASFLVGLAAGLLAAEMYTRWYARSMRANKKSRTP